MRSPKEIAECANRELGLGRYKEKLLALLEEAAEWGRELDVLVNHDSCHKDIRRLRSRIAELEAELAELRKAVCDLPYAHKPQHFVEYAKMLHSELAKARENLKLERDNHQHVVDAAFADRQRAVDAEAELADLRADEWRHMREEADAPTPPDPVKHPSHYTRGGIETINVIEAWQLGFCLGNAIKYISRAGHKGDVLEDLKKARWYIEREIAARSNEDCPRDPGK